MSETFFSYLSLDATAEEAPGLLDGVRDWLLDTGLIVPAPEPGDYDGDFVHGPQSDAVLSADNPREPYAEYPYRDFVKLTADWHAVDPGENLSDAPCPKCTAPRPFDAAAIDQWWESRIEPTVTCAACGHRGPLGDWDSVWTVYFTHASISFREWRWSLSDEFEAELMARLGGRPRKIYTRY